MPIPGYKSVNVPIDTKELLGKLTVQLMTDAGRRITLGEALHAAVVFALASPAADVAQHATPRAARVAE
jgi:hypothetical protein